MRKLTKVLTLFVATAMLCISTISAPVMAIEEQEKAPLIKYDLPYINEQTEMPILGYMGVPGNPIGTITPSFLTRANINAYKEAGFNILSGLYEKVPLHNAEVHKAVELCEELELCYFVCDNKYRSSFEEPQASVPTKDYFVGLMQKDWYFESPAFGGVAVRDEPSIHCFDQMGSVNSAINEITNGKKLMYTNLFPKGANQSQLGFANTTNSSTWEQYDEYVKSYLEKVNPTVLAYDCYTLTKPNAIVPDTNGKDGSVGTYVRSLSMMRAYAKQYNIPFWVTVASHDHVYSRKNIALKQTSWVVNTSLAYGAKGVQYYTYWNDGAGSKNIDSWADQGSERSQGLVSINGALTDNYYRIQKINKNIKLIDEVLLNAEHFGVMQFGMQFVELIPTDVLYSFGKLRDIKGDAFVGCFKYNGNDLYYIVNNSVDSGLKTFKADFIEEVNLKITGLNYVTDENPSGQIVKTGVSSVGFNLSGGEGVLVEVVR